ncbi:MAG TPA: heparinase II/III family protein [Candidatus Krumholzibacteria bacterium]|nr:heparinase II/III family protein [Candidatus Krumholzibacteria bacterium]
MFRIFRTTVMVVAVMAALTPVPSRAAPGGAAASIPTTHPRIWLNNGRLQELRALACRDANGNPIPGCTPSAQASAFFNFMATRPGEAETWEFALLYMMTGDESAATTAIQKADATVACGWQCVAQSHKFFLYVRDYMRNVALVYDWLYDKLTPQERQDYVNYMNLIIFLTWNETAEATSIYDTTHWMTSNPTNNFFYAYLLATAYVSLATYGENPGTFTYQGVTHNCYYLMDGDGSTSYTDMFTFLMAKINDQMWPSLDTRGKGGGWFEGENYGRASKRHLFETLLMLKQTAGLDLFNDPAHPFPRQAFYYELYSIQPGDGVYYPGGDQPNIRTAPVHAYSRELFLQAAEGFAGTVESEYAQYWCNHVYLNMNDIRAMIPVDFLRYHAEFPERNHKASIPPHYLAEAAGWVHSRSDWSNTAMSVVMVSTDRIAGHQHRDQNQFVIYKGSEPNPGANGWVMTEGVPFSSNVADDTWEHNTIVVDDTEQRFGNGTGKILKFDAQSGYVYAVGDASDAYYTNPTHYGPGETKMLKVYQRELVHILPNYVAVFDRVVPQPGFENVVIKSLFHYPHDMPAVSGNLITETLGGARLFQKVVLPSTAVLNWHDEAAEGTDVWRLELTDGTTRPNYQFMNVFQASASTVASMTATDAVSSEDGSMTGAVIKDATQQHVIMFSTDPSGAPPAGSIIYQVGATDPSLHNLFDLKPSTGYRVDVARSAAGYRVNVAEGGTRMTTAAGVLSFELEGEAAPRAVARR